MTKAELIDQMAKVAEVNKKEAEKVLSAFVQVVTENLSKGDATKIIIPSELQGIAGLATTLKEVVTKKKIKNS